MVAGDADDVGAEGGINGGGAEQGGEDLQPVPALTVWAVSIKRQQGLGAHFASPQTLRRAASKAGSWTSTCP